MSSACGNPLFAKSRGRAEPRAVMPGVEVWRWVWASLAPSSFPPSPSLISSWTKAGMQDLLSGMCLSGGPDSAPSPPLSWWSWSPGELVGERGWPRRRPDVSEMRLEMLSQLG